MLQSINGRAKTWIIMPLFGLLILSFVAWGIADVFQGRTANDTVITVGDIEYTGQQLQTEVQRGMEYLRQMTGGAISTKQAMEFGFVQRTTDSMVQRALLQQEAQRLGIVVSDEIIMKAIRALPEFKKADGSFDADAFRKALMRVGASEQIFVAEQRLTLARTQIQQVVATGVTAPELLNKAIAAAAAETRDIELFHVKASAQKTPATPDDKALEAYMADNAKAFSAPETRSLSIVRLSADDVAKGLAVSEEDIKTYYDNRQSEFETPEKRNYKQVVVDTQEAAVKVIAAYNLTRDFDAAAKSVDTTVTTLNAVSKNELPTELREAAFGLSNGNVSAALKSDIGYHVLQQTGVTPASMKTLEQAREEIRTNLLQQEAQDKLYQASAQLDDLIAGGASIEDIAQQMHVQLRKVEDINAKGDNAQGVNAGPILAQPEMLQAAFRLEQGAQSDVISTPAGDYYVVRADKVMPSALKPLATVRAAVVKAWQEDEQLKAANEAAIKVLSAAKKGEPMQAIASEYGAVASVENQLVREDAKWPKYIPGTFAKDIFELKIGEAAQYPATDGVLVARLKAVHHPLTVETADASGDFGQKVAEALQTEVFDAYTQSLEKRYAVKVDQTAIDRLFKVEEE